MATLIGILDRSWWGARTDVNVLVNPKDKSLTWIPRDMYIPSIKDRLNSIFFEGGDHEKYRAAAMELGFPSEYSIVILPSATSQALENVSVTVPVPYRMRFRYPLKPLTDIHLGEKIIEFNPPQETISGERVHQWIGARKWVGQKRPPIEDFYRLIRQQVFVKKLLEQQFNFGLIPTEGMNISDPRAFDDLKQVKADWTFKLFDEAKSDLIDGKAVLLKTPNFRYPYYKYPNITPPPQEVPRTSKMPNIHGVSLARLTKDMLRNARNNRKKS